MSQIDPSPQNPFGPLNSNSFPPLGSNFPNNYQANPRSKGSPLFGVLSLILGGASWLTCCCSYISIPLAISCVAMGHFAVRTPDGRVPGIFGLVLGYPNLLITILFLTVRLFPNLLPDVEDVSPKTAAETAFDAAESEISFVTNGEYYHGNSSSAEELAKEFSDMMKELREKLFTPEKKKLFSLSQGNFVTWCELRENQCLFLVHVPGYRKFTLEAKESLNDLAWIAARRVGAQKIKPGGQLGLGMKGTILYDIVRIANLPVDPEEAPEVIYDGADKQNLLVFFEPEPVLETLDR